MSKQQLAFAKAILEDAHLARPGDDLMDIDPEDGISNCIERTREPWGCFFPVNSDEALQRSRLAREGGKASQDAARTAGAAQGFSLEHMTGNRLAGGTDGAVKSAEEIKATRVSYGKSGKAHKAWQDAIEPGAAPDVIDGLKRKAAEELRDSSDAKSQNTAGKRSVAVGSGKQLSERTVTIELIVNGLVVPIKRNIFAVANRLKPPPTKSNVLNYTRCIAPVRNGILESKVEGIGTVADFEREFEDRTPMLSKIDGRKGIEIKVVDMD